MTYLPIELQKHIISFLSPTSPCLHHSKGRCIAKNKTNNKRCAVQINYHRSLTCHVHNSLGDVLSSQG